MSIQKKRILGIYFSHPDGLGYPLNKQVFYEAYAEVITDLASRGIQAVIVRANSYTNGCTFAWYFAWNGTTFVRHDQPITVDLVWNRDDQNTIELDEDCPVINLLAFDTLCRDKWLTYQHLRQFSPVTKLLQSYDDWKNIKSEFGHDLVVLKPRLGEQAQGVHVLPVSQVTYNLYESWQNILLQTWLDSTKGIAGLYQGAHELNVNVVDGQFAGARLKKLNPGSLVATVTGERGGCTVQGLARDELPEAAWQFVQTIDTTLAVFMPRMYRLDFVQTTLGFKVIELNSRPGLMHRNKEGKHYQDFNGAIVALLVRQLEIGS